MKLYCDDEVKNLLPSIKGAICEDLIFKMNYSQKKAADILGITQPMVNKYLHHKYSFSIENTISMIRKNKRYIEMMGKFLKQDKIENLDLLINSLLSDKDFVDGLRIE